MLRFYDVLRNTVLQILFSIFLSKWTSEQESVIRRKKKSNKWKTMKKIEQDFEIVV